jgi:hypothetical protein
MPEVKAMVAQDPSMLDRFSNAENKQMVEDVLAKRRKKTRGTRANNLTAAADAKRTMDRLMTEVSCESENESEREMTDMRPRSRTSPSALA